MGRVEHIVGAKNNIANSGYIYCQTTVTQPVIKPSLHPNLAPTPPADLNRPLLSP